MFEVFRNQSRSASGAIKYVTIGVLMMIWAGLWYYYFIRPVAEAPTWQKFACVGTILSGFAIATIGLLFGLIGRGAKGADTTVGMTSTVSPSPVVPVAPVELNAAGAVTRAVATPSPAMSVAVKPTSIR